RDRRAAAGTRLAFASVDLELVLHRAAVAVRGPVVAERRSLSLYADLERPPDASSHGGDPVGVEAAGGAERTNARVPERLAGVEVSEPRHRALVEERRLHRRPPACQAVRQLLGG